MSGRTVELGGSAVYVAGDAPPLAHERDASQIIGEAFSSGAKVVAVPVARLSADFLDLKTRLAGEVLQKFVNYGFQVAIVGDVSERVAASDSLRDFVRESNRGRHVWFVDDLEALAAKLSA